MIIIRSRASIFPMRGPLGVLGHSAEFSRRMLSSRSDPPSVQSNDTGQSFLDVSDEMSRVGAIVGGVLGGIIALLLALALWVFLRRRKLAKDQNFEVGLDRKLDEKSQSSMSNPSHPWLQNALNIFRKAPVPSSRVAPDPTEKYDPSRMKGFHRPGNVVSISRPKPARVPSPPFPAYGGSSKRSPDLPFLIIPPPAGGSTTQPQVLPATSRDRGGRRKIQIPPQAVVINPVSRQKTYKLSLSESGTSRSSASPNSEDMIDSLPRLSKILPPLPASRGGGRNSGTRRPLPSPPDVAEHTPRRVAKQVAFAGIETISGGPSRKKSTSSTQSNASSVRAEALRREVEELRKEVKFLSKHVVFGESVPPPLYSNT